MFRSTMSYFSDKTYFRGLKHERIKICLLVSNAATGCFPCAGNSYYIFNFSLYWSYLDLLRLSTLNCMHYLTEKMYEFNTPSKSNCILGLYVRSCCGDDWIPRKASF